MAGGAPQLLKLQAFILLTSFYYFISLRRGPTNTYAYT